MRHQDHLAAGGHADVFHGHAGVTECTQDGLGGEVDRILVDVLAELGHVDPEDPDALTHGDMPLEG